MDVFEHSLSIAQDIIDNSYNLVAAEAEAREHYRERDKYFKEILGEDMHLVFQPDISTPISAAFLDVMDEEVKKKAEVFFNNYGDPAQGSRAAEYYVSELLQEHVTDNNLLMNTIPDKVMDFIYESESLHDIRSPKLSKLLVRVYGEKSKVVKWYTNKCPRRATRGREQQIHVSVMPHHIVGMSYYAPLNHGGAKWLTGFSGTSCMDPVKNSAGKTILQLMASLRDEYLAVAYLTDPAGADIWQPKYLARALIRVFYIGDTPHLVLCRPYYVSNAACHVLVEGLKQQFEHIHFVEEIREKHTFSPKEKFELPYSANVAYHVESNTVTCGYCEGSGKDPEEPEWECEECEGTGELDIAGDYLPYVDDSDCVLVDYTGEFLTVELPNDYLLEKGIELPAPSIPETTRNKVNIRTLLHLLAG